MLIRKLIATLAVVALIVTSCGSSAKTGASTTKADVTTTAEKPSTIAPSSSAVPESSTTANGSTPTPASTSSSTAPKVIVCGDGSKPVVKTSGWCERRSNDAALVVDGAVPPPQCIYRAGELLVPTNTPPKVVTDLAGYTLSSTPIGETGYYLATFSGADPVTLAQQVDLAVPNYLVSGAMGWTFGPGGDAKALESSAKSGGGGLDQSTTVKKTVAVLDTGLDLQAKVPVKSAILPSKALVAYLAMPTRRASQPTWPATANISEVDVGLTAGHGTFIASILTHLVPSADVSVGQIPSWLIEVAQDVGAAGATKSVSWQVAVTDTATVAATLSDPELKNFDYLNLSLGSYGCPEDVVFRDVTSTYWRSPTPIMKAISELAKPLVFAAAGNDVSEQPFYPAAWGSCGVGGVLGCPAGDKGAAIAAQISSVGSNDCLGTCASKGAAGTMGGRSFSNKGSWVEYPGVEGAEVVGFRPDTRETAKATATALAGPYEWSGTSFATPCALALHLVGKLGSTTDCGLRAPRTT
jgi:hypothetical protein